VYEDLSSGFSVDLLHGYVGFPEYCAAKPLSRILRTDVRTGATTVVFEERNWIGHVNASPTLPQTVMFCHEGPWDKVDVRIWGLDLETGRVWPIRRATPGEHVGHEHWLADGQRIGYQGKTADGRHFFGSIRSDDTDPREYPFRLGSTHVHSHDGELIVGDGPKYPSRLLLWRLRDRRFEGPRCVLNHGGAFEVQQLHAHPRFDPRGDKILFTSNQGGYGNLYLVDKPDFDSFRPLSPF
jgi:oligogalacturonide lyase